MAEDRRVVRFTLHRNPASRGGAVGMTPLAAMVLAMGGLFLAAPGEADSLPLAGDRMHSAYPLRFALPEVQAAPDAPEAPGRRELLLASLERPDGTLDAKPAAEDGTAPVPLVRAAPAPARSKVPGVIALNYNLAGGAEAGDAIEVNKPVVVGDADAGRIPLRIDGNARVYALGSRLAAIIAARSGIEAVPDDLGDDFVSLERLRALGVGVRYDAIRDRLVIDPPA